MTKGMSLYLGSVVILSSFYASLAYASSDSLWDNFKGYVPNTGCREVQVSDLDIKASAATVLLDKNGNPWQKLVEGSLIKIKEGVKDKVVGGVTYKAIRLVGVPGEAALLADNNYAKKGISLAYLDARAIRPLESYDLSISEVTSLLVFDSQGKEVPDAAPILLPQVASSGVNVKGSIWQVAKRDGRYLTWICGEAGKEATYTVFDVFDPNAAMSTTRVGVNKDSTRIFNDIASTPRVPVVVPAENPVIALPVMPLQKPLALQVAPVPAELKYVVCSTNATAFLRKDNAVLNTPQVETFEVKRMQEIRPLSLDAPVIRKVTIQNIAHDYVKVQVVGATAEDQKFAWVAKTYVQRKPECKPLTQPKPVMPVSNAVIKDAKCAKGIPARYANVKASDYAGKGCKKGDTDEFKCLLCVLQGEANLSSFEGQREVARTVFARQASGKYPEGICKIAWQSGQFVGLNSGDIIPKDLLITGLLVKSVKDAYCKGSNGYLGFRTCSYAKGKNYGGNCFRKSGDIEDMDDFQRIMELVNPGGIETAML